MTVILLLVGCGDLTIQESELQKSIDRQLPLKGLVTIPVALPKEVAEISSLFLEERQDEVSIEADLNLRSFAVALYGKEGGYAELRAESLISTSILGLEIEEPMTLSARSGIRLGKNSNSLYFSELQITNVESAFVNRFVPDNFRIRLFDAVNEWLSAYFSAYPIYKTEGLVGWSPTFLRSRQDVNIEDDHISVSRL